MIAKYLHLHNFYSHTDTKLTFDKEITLLLVKSKEATNQMVREKAV